MAIGCQRSQELAPKLFPRLVIMSAGGDRITGNSNNSNSSNNSNNNSTSSNSSSSSDSDTSNTIDHSLQRHQQRGMGASSGEEGQQPEPSRSSHSSHASTSSLVRVRKRKHKHKKHTKRKHKKHKKPGSKNDQRQRRPRLGQPSEDTANDDSSASTSANITINVSINANASAKTDGTGGAVGTAKVGAHKSKTETERDHTASTSSKKEDHGDDTRRQEDDGNSSRPLFATSAHPKGVVGTLRINRQHLRGSSTVGNIMDEGSIGDEDKNGSADSSTTTSTNSNGSSQDGARKSELNEADNSNEAKEANAKSDEDMGDAAEKTRVSGTPASLSDPADPPSSLGGPTLDGGAASATKDEETPAGDGSTARIDHPSDEAAAASQRFIRDILKDDILFGRGKPFQNHPGNQRMHRIVDSFREEYAQSPRNIKSMISQSIVLRLKNDHNARFLRRADEDEAPPTSLTTTEKGLWEEVDNHSAREKIAHAFRNRSFKRMRAKGLKNQKIRQQRAKKGVKADTNSPIAPHWTSDKTAVAAHAAGMEGVLPDLAQHELAAGVAGTGFSTSTFARSTLQPRSARALSNAPPVRSPSHHQTDTSDASLRSLLQHPHQLQLEQHSAYPGLRPQSTLQQAPDLPASSLLGLEQQIRTLQQQRRQGRESSPQQQQQSNHAAQQRREEYAAALEASVLDLPTSSLVLDGGSLFGNRPEGAGSMQLPLSLSSAIAPTLDMSIINQTSLPPDDPNFAHQSLQQLQRTIRLQQQQQQHQHQQQQELQQRQQQQLEQARHRSRQILQNQQEAIKQQQQEQQHRRQQIRQLQQAQQLQELQELRQLQQAHIPQTATPAVSASLAAQLGLPDPLLLGGSGLVDSLDSTTTDLLLQQRLSIMETLRMGQEQRRHQHQQQLHHAVAGINPGLAATQQLQQEDKEEEQQQQRQRALEQLSHQLLLGQRQQLHPASFLTRAASAGVQSAQEEDDHEKNESGNAGTLRHSPSRGQK